MTPPVVPVIVGANCTGNGPLNGGIYVSGNVRDLQLGHSDTGQVIVIYTPGVPNPSYLNRRTVIVENRTAVPPTVTVTRQCRKTGVQNDNGNCDGTTSGTWWKDVTFPGGATSPLREQTFNGVFSPHRDLLSATTPDRGVIFVNNGDVGEWATVLGLRRGLILDINTSMTWEDSPYAIYQNTAEPKVGSRLTVAADGNIWITGHLNYRVDPRGSPAGGFSQPIPGEPIGTSDDQLDVQNVLGIVSWATPSPRNGGVRVSRNLTGDLETHGMIFVASLSGQPGPSGQFSFDDPDGLSRGTSKVLGGVVQKTMGRFGQPDSNTGYDRKWVYDERFRYRALTPPAFPSFPRFTAATSLGIDSYTWRLGLFN